MCRMWFQISQSLYAVINTALFQTNDNFKKVDL